MSITAPRTNNNPFMPPFLLPIGADIRRVEEVLHAELTSPVQIVAGVSRHILDAGGKRLRPSLVILCARACSASSDQDRIANVAASMELTHMATLVHDDVIDSAESRRGRKTANSSWGNHISILTGDFMLAKAVSLLAQDGDIRIIQALSRATIAMTEGEISQIEAQGDTRTAISSYLSIIRGKTAEFMSACCRIGAILASADEEEEALAEYGLNLGLAFQITDDLLDLIGDPAQTGKPIGGDIREGKITMPIILTMEKASPPNQLKLESILHNDGVTSGDIEFVCSLAESTGAIEDTRQAAARYVEQAIGHLQTLPDSDARNSLHELAQYILDRKS